MSERPIQLVRCRRCHMTLGHVAEDGAFVIGTVRVKRLVTVHCQGCGQQKVWKPGLEEPIGAGGEGQHGL